MEENENNQKQNLEQNAAPKEEGALNQGLDKENPQNLDNSDALDTKGEDKEPKGDKKEAGDDIYGSPENFDYSQIQLPEGMELDQELLKEFEPVARELNLSNKSANKLMDLAVKLTTKNAQGIEDLLAQFQEQKSNSYIKLLNEDKDLNVGDKAQYEEYLDVAIQGLNATATSGFKELLKTEGLTHHPEFIKTFHKIGELCISEKMPDVKIPPSQKEVDPADILYGASSEK